LRRFGPGSPRSPIPEIPVISIVDLGIVRDVEVADDGACDVTITPTYSGCPAMQVIADAITDALHARGVAEVRLHSQLSPAWTTDWMSEEGKAKLTGYGIAPPAQQVIDISGLRGGRRDHAAISRRAQPRLASPAPTAAPRTPKSPASSAPRPARPCTNAWTAASPSTTSSATKKIMSKFHPLTISQVRNETRDTIAVTFAVPPELRDSFAVPARPAPDPARADRRRRRAPLVLDLLRRAGRRAARGHQAHAGRPVLQLGQRHLKPGVTLDVMPPMGHFNVPLDAANRKHYLAFAAGSGITPILSIIKTTLGGRAAQPLHAVLRQPRLVVGDLQGRTVGPQGHLHGAPEAGLCDEPRAAGHRTVQRPHHQGQRPRNS
jgi:ring-1,2-phenylacetyl-CoA epoxidase subunit PaaD